MFSRFLFFSFALAFVIYLGANTLEQQKNERKLRVILVTAESLRADLVSSRNCPQLFEAAKQGYSFNNHRAVSGWTGTNIVSLLSGLAPFQSGVHTRGQSIDPSIQLPLEQLKNDGYAITGLQPFMAMDIYRNLGMEVAQTSPDPLLWCSKQQLANQPFFLWYHYVNSHLPYTQPKDRDSLSVNLASSDSKRLHKITVQSAIHHDEARYHRDEVPLINTLQLHNIREFDTWFGKLWNFYTKGGLRKNTVLIVTADHGDEHGERQMVGHASTTLAGHLHEEIVRIPLFIWLPKGIRPEKVATKRLTSHLDIIPTLFSLLERTLPPSYPGNNLFGGSVVENSWTAMTSSGGFAEPDPEAIRYFEYSHIRENWKSRYRVHLQDKHPRQWWLYNLDNDPQELTNVASLHPEIVTAHRNHLSGLIAKQVTRPVTVKAPGTVTMGSKKDPPIWSHPKSSGLISFKKLKGRFFLEWQGSPDEQYLLEYKAGYGAKAINGNLEITGNVKKFGTINELYWNTWIVPNNPYALRVKQKDGPWSDWITLEAVP